jgi:hypothetical protein
VKKRSSWSRGLLKSNRARKATQPAMENGIGEKSLNGISADEDKDQSNNEMSDEVNFTNFFIHCFNIDPFFDKYF